LARATLTATDTRDHLEELDRAADRAAAAAGGYLDRYFRVAGHVARIRFAGAALIDALTMSLRHVEVAPASEPALTIRAWDSASTGTALPEAVRELDPAREHLLRHRFGDAGESFVEAGEGSVSALDVERSAAHFWAEAAGGQRVTALSPILAAWLPPRGVVLAAAAAVGRPAGCVLIVGGTGSGKSTAAAACLARGLGYLGDDSSLIGPGEPPTIFSLNDTLQVQDGRGKSTVHISEGLLLEAPLRAIAIVHITGDRESRIGQATPAAALAAMAPGSILQLPAPRPLAFRRLAAIARSVPCHRLEAGTDPSLLADTVAGLL
jgi:hypothetical protein